MGARLVKGKDLAGLGIGEDDLVVVVDGMDVYAPHLLRDYAARCSESGVPGVAEAAVADAVVLQRLHERDPTRVIFPRDQPAEKGSARKRG